MFSGENISDLAGSADTSPGLCLTRRSRITRGSRIPFFAPGGDTIVVSDNIFFGPVRDIPPAPGCDNVIFRNNVESVDKRDQPKDMNFRRKVLYFRHNR